VAGGVVEDGRKRDLPGVFVTSLPAS